jgi:hypothetical protein
VLIPGLAYVAVLAILVDVAVEVALFLLWRCFLDLVRLIIDLLFLSLFILFEVVVN